MILRFVAILVLAATLLGCKQDVKTDSSSSSYSKEDGLITMKGDFIYIDNAAVLQTSRDIYGVVVDDQMKELHKAVKPFQANATDMVPVTVRVRKFEKPADEEGWPYRVEIKEVLKVEEPDSNSIDVIKLGE
ncbi:hypothetical protein FJ651_04555 [Paucihalobacter ruber]|uniref:NlpE C-terminal OB domain-containing protein n=1 Tax=Paucihalobacter ruber TaxID=2567861 RepID=A0A506PRG0_9FLAO|nr:hypothetical protein [Paucihalobacter ruber]TPV34810.1 hypothetical protein FJ651_04555 [Paucihalobacter ruber]